MKELKTFDSKAKKDIEVKFDDIYPNEVVWTYLVAEMAHQNDQIYEMISGFKPADSHKIYCEGQPLTPYKKLEGNSCIDMALGALDIRDNTVSGMRFSKNNGSAVCFAEAKYLSDLSGKTTHSATRNQMDRVIENLLWLNDNNAFPEKIVFTLLTPRLFKQNSKSRLYGYKYDEYSNLIQNSLYDGLYERVILSQDQSDYRESKLFSKTELKERLKNIEIRWVTFEEIFQVFDPTLKECDLTDKDNVLSLWKLLKQKKD